MTDLAHRHDQNPLLSPADIKPSIEGMEVACLLNPGAFRFAGKTWLLLRVAERPLQQAGKTSFPILDAHEGVRVLEFDNSDPKLDLSDPRVVRYDRHDYLTTMSHLRLVVSEDGIHFTEPPENKPMLGHGELETFGIEDCRVTRVEATYYLTFTEVSEHGVGVGLKSTQDWVTFRHHGMIFPPHNKDCTLFDDRIGGKYYALHRPSSPELGGNFIWIAESLDLEHWGNHKCIAHSRKGYWDSKRVGAGAAPIKTDHGWLEIYHGANEENRYCLGALLLDLNSPWKVIARSEDPIMEPLESYERNGFFGEVIFTNGHVLDGDSLTIYYGASDSVVCSARFSLETILDSLSLRQAGQS
jgi:beta-1,2-mannobiose phosphorylase / 1,2-beta-oligomannan phosphorylase